MDIVAENYPPGNTSNVPLLRSRRTLRGVSVHLLVRLVIVAINFNEAVAGARITDLRAELRRREEAVL
jgi:hypothetical protein